MADTSDTTKMNLTNDLTVSNGTGTFHFKAGQNVEVPKAMADNLAEMDYTHNQYLQGLNTKHSHIVDSGTIAVGSGAE